MSRRTSLLLAASVAALLVISPVSSVAAELAPPTPEEGPIITVKLDLKASNGLRAQLETSQKEMVTLELRRENQFVSYEVQGEVTESGLKVRFGRLGLIDVAFVPTGTLDSTEPSDGCTGAPRTLREGIFTGTIEFTGEQDYVRIEGPEAVGSMSVISQWQCPEEPTPFAGPSRLLSHESKEDSEHASLHAESRRCLCFFAAGMHHRDRKGRKGRSIFYGVTAERREGMGIIRLTQAFGAPSDFVFDHLAGTATLRPPPPFRGRATYRERPGRDLWRSTIRAPLLGADPLRTDGPGFRARLFPRIPLRLGGSRPLSSRRQGREPGGPSASASRPRSPPRERSGPGCTGR